MPHPSIPNQHLAIRFYGPVWYEIEVTEREVMRGYAMQRRFFPVRGHPSMTVHEDGIGIFEKFKKLIFRYDAQTNRQEFIRDNDKPEPFVLETARRLGINYFIGTMNTGRNRFDLNTARQCDSLHDLQKIILEEVSKRTPSRWDPSQLSCLNYSEIKTKPVNLLCNNKVKRIVYDPTCDSTRFHMQELFNVHVKYGEKKSFFQVTNEHAAVFNFFQAIVAQWQFMLLQEGMPISLKSNVKIFRRDITHPPYATYVEISNIEIVTFLKTSQNSLWARMGTFFELKENLSTSTLQGANLKDIFDKECLNLRKLIDFFESPHHSQNFGRAEMVSTSQTSLLPITNDMPDNRCCTIS
jgi:hypothetical protein